MDFVRYLGPSCNEKKRGRKKLSKEEGLRCRSVEEEKGRAGGSLKGRNLSSSRERGRGGHSWVKPYEEGCLCSHINRKGQKEVWGEKREGGRNEFSLSGKRGRAAAEKRKDAFIHSPSTGGGEICYEKSKPSSSPLGGMVGEVEGNRHRREKVASTHANSLRYGEEEIGGNTRGR